MILGISDLRTAQPGVNITPGPDGRPILGSSPCSANFAQGEGWVACTIAEDENCSYCGQPANHSKTQLSDRSFIYRCQDCTPEVTAGLPRRPTKFGGSGDKNEIMEYITGQTPKPYLPHHPEKESVMMLVYGAPGLFAH